MPETDPKPTPSSRVKSDSSAVVTSKTPARVSTYLDAQEASLRSDRQAEQRKADDHEREAAFHHQEAVVHATNVQRLTGALAQIKEMRQTYPSPEPCAEAAPADKV